MFFFSDRNNCKCKLTQCYPKETALGKCRAANGEEGILCCRVKKTDRYKDKKPN